MLGRHQCAVWDTSFDGHSTVQTRKAGINFCMRRLSHCSYRKAVLWEGVWYLWYMVILFGTYISFTGLCNSRQLFLHTGTFLSPIHPLSLHYSQRFPQSLHARLPPSLHLPRAFIRHRRFDFCRHYRLRRLRKRRLPLRLPESHQYCSNPLFSSANYGLPLRRTSGELELVFLS